MAESIHNSKHTYSRQWTNVTSQMQAPAALALMKVKVRTLEIIAKYLTAAGNRTLDVRPIIQLISYSCSHWSIQGLRGCIHYHTGRYSVRQHLYLHLHLHDGTILCLS
jgi:hypothetical protein